MGKMLDRRSFVEGIAAAGAAIAGAGLLGCTPNQTASAARKDDADGGADWLGDAPDVSEADCVEVVETEVLVVGAGCAGYFAANFAAEEGARVLLIEKNEAGCGIRDSALGAIGSRLQKAQGVEIDKIELLNDLFTYANGQVNIALHRIWAENSGEAIDWYCDLAAQVEGVTVDLEWDMPQEPTRYHHWPIAHGTNDGTDLVGGIQTAVVGKIMGALYARLVSNGGEIRYQTPLVSLAKEGDRVVGAYAKNDQGDYVRINASKGVIVATGGYVNNAEMYQALQGQINKSVSGWCCHATFPATGDGIKACLWAGARFDNVKTTMIFDRGLVRPDLEFDGPDSGGYYFALASQPFLKVNLHGKRFCNESTPYDYVIHAANSFENHAWYMVWDDGWASDVLRFHTTGCSTIDLHEGGDRQAAGLEATGAEIDDLVKQGLVVKADTIE